LGDSLKGNLLLFYEPLLLEAQHCPSVRRHQFAVAIPEFYETRICRDN
jgi:hypothetical protein